MVAPTIYNNTTSASIARFSNDDTASNGTNIVEGETFNMDANLFNVNLPGSNIDTGVNFNLGLLNDNQSEINKHPEHEQEQFKNHLNKYRKM